MNSSQNNDRFRGWQEELYGSNFITSYQKSQEQDKKGPHFVEKLIHKNIAYYTLTWSKLEPCKKDIIINRVPSQAGIWEIYNRENPHKLRILKMGLAWYGGLRHELRAETDPTLDQNEEFRSQLERDICSFRYLIYEVLDDIHELYHVLRSLRGFPPEHAPPKKRYVDVRIAES